MPKTIPSPEAFAFWGSLLHPFSCFPSILSICRPLQLPMFWQPWSLWSNQGHPLKRQLADYGCDLLHRLWDRSTSFRRSQKGTEMGHNLGPSLGMQFLHVFVMFGIQLCIFKAPNSDCCLNNPQLRGWGAEPVTLARGCRDAETHLLHLIWSMLRLCHDCCQLKPSNTGASPTVHQCLDLFNGNGLEVHIPYFSTDLIVWSWLYVYIPRYPSHLLRAWALPLCRGHPVGA